MSHRPDQGRIARSTAFWALAILIVYGCISLNESLAGFFAEPMGASFGSTLNAEGRRVGGMTVPILSWKLTPALIVAILVCTGAIYGIHRYLSRPKTADLLIETESEMRKVTWPTMNEAVTSSIVVIVCVVFLMTFLAGTDWVLSRWVDWILLGGS